MRKERYLLKIFPAIEEIQSDILRKKVLEIWSEVWEESHWETPESCPFNPNFPDISLVDHINSLWEIAKGVCEVIEKYYADIKIDRDLLWAGILLHDVSKMLEMEPGTDGKVEYSRLLDYLPHSVFGAMKSFNKGLPLKVLNIIISHTKLTGQSPVTPEAMLLHYLDYGIADLLRLCAGLPTIYAEGPLFGKK